MAKKKLSYKGKKQYPHYKNEGRFAKNKKRKLERHLKKHPNDAVAKKVLEKGGFEYNRPVPKVRKWHNAVLKKFIETNNKNVRRTVADKEKRKYLLIVDPIEYQKMMMAA